MKTLHIRLSDREYEELKILRSELHCGSWKGLVFKLRDLIVLRSSEDVKALMSSLELKDTQNIFKVKDKDRLVI